MTFQLLRSIDRARPVCDGTGRALPLRRKPRVALVEGLRPSPCWLVATRYGWSTGSTRYATLALADGRRVVAHRWAWAAYHGREVPAGMVVHHACYRGSCINPEHLDLATFGENSALSNRDLRQARAHLTLLVNDSARKAAA